MAPLGDDLSTNMSESSLNVLLGRLMNAMEHIPERLDEQQKCLNSLKMDFRMFKERDLPSIKQKMKDLEKSLKTITDSDTVQLKNIDTHETNLEEIKRNVASLKVRMDDADTANEKKSKTVKEIAWWTLKQFGLLVAAILTAYLTVKFKNG